MTPRPRSLVRSSRAPLGLWPALWVLAACRAPEPQRQGSLGDLERLLQASAPVSAQLVEGSVPLERDNYALADPAEVTPPEHEDSTQQEAAQARLNPYLRFGERIIVREFEGLEPFITKPYTMPPGKALKLVTLMEALQPFPFEPRPKRDPETNEEPPLNPDKLEFEVLEGWDQEVYSTLNVGDKAPTAGVPVVTSDVIVVTATYSRLEAFEEFLDLFAAAGVPQIELEAKLIEVVETDTLDLGVNGSFLFGGSNFIKGFDFNLPNLASGTEAILSLGAVQSSVTFDAMLEAVQAWDNVQIDSRPKTVVRAGGVAYIESTTEIPYFEIKTLNTAGDFTTNTVYKKVGVQLYISPRIIGTKMLALDVHLIGSQQVGSQATFGVAGGGAAGGTVIEVPVIAYRTAKTVVYLEPGQTLVIGGLTTEREREFHTKVPLLGDLPLLGLLFRSTFTRKEKQHVLFAISPRILQNSDFESEF